MISCVIRTFNEGKLIDQLLSALSVQSIGMPEIVVVDSGSTDGTVETVKTYKTKLIQIKKEDFNYSYALNLGIQNAKHELIAILSGHSIPYDESWLEKMSSHFKDEKVAGVYCKQIPMPGADPYEALRIRKMFSDSEKTEANFSNAACCIRKSIWQEHQFAILPAAEDKEWAQWAISNGYKIIYEPKAEVYHSHNECCRKSANRIIEIERANDLRIMRKRSNALTLKQSAGLFVRDFKKLGLIDGGFLKKLSLTRDCAARSFWYAYDFKRNKNG
jgi:rhamnosyltransferase